MKYNVNGKMLNVNSIIKKYGVVPSEFKKLVQEGKSVEESISLSSNSKVEDDVSCQKVNDDKPVKVEAYTKENSNKEQPTRRASGIEYTAKGFTGTLRELAEHFDLSYSNLRKRLVINEEDPETVISELVK